jgi:hypothetical protein
VQVQLNEIYLKIFMLYLLEIFNIIIDDGIDIDINTNLRDNSASAGSERCSSIDTQVTSPAECLNLLWMYLSSCNVYVIQIN